MINISVHAQPAQQWVPDQRVPGYLDDTFTPFLIEDQNNTVHALTSQWVDDGDRRLAITYRKWTLLGGWTRPVDVLLAPTGNANFLASYLDKFGILHVFFSSGDGKQAAIYYANALASVADSALNWSVPQIVANDIVIDSGALTGDGQGNLVFIYSGNIHGNGVYAIQSSDSGQNWSDPVPVFLTQDKDLVPYSLRIVTGPEQKMKASWNVVTSLGVDESLYFASYETAAGKWNKPVKLDTRIDLPGYFGPSFPAIVDNGKEIVILYNGGNPYAGGFVNAGRPIMRASLSGDAGLSWSELADPFPLLNGRSGEHALVVDSTGGAHGLFTMRIDQSVGGENKIIAGIWHSVFQDGIWSNPDRIVTTIAPHDVRAVVSQGNVLLVVWRGDPGILGSRQHGVWYSYMTLNIPELPIIPLPTNSSVPLIIPTAVVTQVPTTLSGQLSEDQRRITSSAANPATPLLFGVIPVILVLFGMFIFYRKNRSRYN